MYRPDSSALLLALSLLFLPLQQRVALAEASRMTGRVLDAGTLSPIEGAEIELANMNAGQGFFRTHSDKAGTFTIDGIASNRYYVLTVSAPGYADFLLNAWQFPDAQRAVEVAIPLDRAGTLEVRATRADGNTAAPNARVTIVSERATRWWEGARPAPAPVFTDAKGVARFVDIQSGSWAVTVDLPGFLTTESRQVAVRRGETTTVPASLVKPGSLSGAVQLADGSPVPNVTITARGPAEGVGTSGPEGEFTIEGLPPGRYRLDLSQDGFVPYGSRETYTLEESTSRGGISVAVTPNPPEFAIVMDREAFVPGTEMRLGLRSYRVSTLGLTLFSIPTARLLDPARDFRLLTDLPDTTGLRVVKRFDHAPTEGPPYAWREEQVLLPTDIVPGAYLLRARGAGMERRAIFFVTDLGILVKRSPTHALVSAASLKTGDPVAGASVYVTNAEPGGGGGLQWPAGLRAAVSRPPATTDLRGLVEIQRIGLSAERFVAVSVDHGVSVAESPVLGGARQGGDRDYLYTERPIYRPGQTVYWKLFARTEHGQGYGMPTDDRASVALIGPDGSSRAIASTGISSSGTSDSSFVLPADAALGDWRVSGTVGRATSGATFAVQEYRKPEFKVDVTPDREVYVNGDEVRFVVASNYFFGSPVFGATVRYNLFESRLDAWASFEESEGEGDEEDESPRPGYGRVLMTGEARTDVDGRVAIGFTPPRVTYDRRVSLEVEVLDASNRAVSARGSAIVGRGLFTIQVRPSTALVLAGQAIGIDVRTADHLGKPVTAAVQVDLDQDAWSPLEHRYVRSTRPLASTTVTTDATGKGALSLLPSPARSGYLKILARADDVKGNRVTDESSVWVYDAAVRQYAYRYPNLEAFLDRDHYAAGDTARILINTDARDTQVLATVEGKEIEAVQVVPLVGSTGLVSVPVRAEYAPNVFVSVSVRRGAEVRSRTLELSVAGPKHDLAIHLETDRPEYRPRDEAHIRVETRDGAGHPESAEVSVGVVDEAI